MSEGDSPTEEVRVSRAGDKVELRIFSRGAGPAKIMMPTKRGLTIPANMIPQLIAAVVAAAETPDPGRSDG